MLKLHSDPLRWPEIERFRFEERAAIREYDGGQSREDAERYAEKEIRSSVFRSDIESKKVKSSSKGIEQ
jgi:hypothetical protein